MPKVRSKDSFRLTTRAQRGSAAWRAFAALKNGRIPAYDWLTQNTKIAKMSGARTYNWGIPAYRSASGFATCPQAGACAVGCYATQGAYTFGNVKPAFEARLALARESFLLVRTLDSEIKRRGIKRIRIHDSGDFFSPVYLNAWLEIMRRNPDTAFYAYTKSVALIKGYAARGILPSNFTVVFSYGGKEDRLIDPSVDRHSRVFASDEECGAAGYVNTAKNDAHAADPSVRCVGLVYHGTKALSNTAWESVGVPNATPIIPACAANTEIKHAA